MSNENQAVNDQVQAANNENIQQLPAVSAPTPSERFTAAVQREFASNAGQLTLTSFQKKLIQNFFLKIDSILKDSEIKRQAKPEQYRDPVSYTWDNINIPKLAVDVITFSSVGLDPMQDNQLSPIPYKNAKTGKYDVTFIIGYRGMELKAKKYGLDVPDEVVVKLVHNNDVFVPFWRDKNNDIESYTFETPNVFNRGEVIGGFWFHSFSNNPQKNKLKTFTRADIEKRKPDHAAAEFWGGEKDVWGVDPETGRRKVVGKETVDGWFEEMAEKTLTRSAYNAITIDSQKIDEHYLAVVEREKESHDRNLRQVIEQNANGSKGADAIGFEDAVTLPEGTAVPVPEMQANMPPPPVYQSNNQASEPGVKQAPF